MPKIGGMDGPKFIPSHLAWSLSDSHYTSIRAPVNDMGNRATVPLHWQYETAVPDSDELKGSARKAIAHPGSPNSSASARSLSIHTLKAAPAGPKPLFEGNDAVAPPGTCQRGSNCAVDSPVSKTGSLSIHTLRPDGGFGRDSKSVRNLRTPKTQLFSEPASFSQSQAVSLDALVSTLKRVSDDIESYNPSETERFWAQQGLICCTNLCRQFNCLIDKLDSQSALNPAPSASAGPSKRTFDDLETVVRRRIQGKSNVHGTVLPETHQWKCNFVFLRYFQYQPPFVVWPQISSPQKKPSQSCCRVLFETH